MIVFCDNSHLGFWSNK